MNIHLHKPYKIIESKHKRYDSHYKILSAKSVVVPVKQLDQEVLCDICWVNESNECQVLHHAMFVIDNLIPINPMTDDKLSEMFNQHYLKLQVSN